MQLTHIRIDHFRNIPHLSVNPKAGFNWWIGPNGVGKTSILEAIYLLGSGRSFRSAQIARVIHHGMDSLSIYGETKTPVGQESTLGIVRDMTGKYQAKVGGQPAQQVTLAKALPLILIHPDSAAIVSGDAAHRRQFIDSAMFHVEHRFQSYWSGYQRVLKQRNLLLKSRQRIDPALFAAWNTEFVLYGEQLTAARQVYIDKLLEMLRPLVQEYLQLQAVQVLYAPGWPEGRSLEESLAATALEERARGFSVVGPHRADLEFHLENAKARQILSRGQQKRFLYLLFLAQCHVFQQIRQENPIFLIDDLGSELDAENRAAILSLLAQTGCQSFLTAIEPRADDNPETMFHVEHYREESVKTY